MNAQVEQGQTKLTDWQDYAGGGIFVEVDTSNYQFKSTPHFLVSLHGEKHQWRTVGSNCVYNDSADGFSLYLKWAANPDSVFQRDNPLSATLARECGWIIKWTAIIKS